MQNQLLLIMRITSNIILYIKRVCCTRSVNAVSNVGSVSDQVHHRFLQLKH